MRKEITTRNRGDFFVVLFGIVGFFAILREYRAAAGVDVHLSPQSLFRVGFEMKFLKLFLELPIIFTTFVSTTKQKEYED